MSSDGDDAGRWRVGHEGRDRMYYEEFEGGEWRRLELGGEMGTGRAHHVIYFGSRDDWSRRPAWARGRRDEIIARIKRAFPIPGYEYEGEGVLDDHDRALLIAAAGGLSEDECGWVNCQERAMKNKRLCVHHAFQER